MELAPKHLDFLSRSLGPFVLQWTSLGKVERGFRSTMLQHSVVLLVPVDQYSAAQLEPLELS